ncbi:MAG: hypothetical protein RMK29_22215, partial [Myxococcales bacterium]|nr:hypothetical protein [Myxococcales bacterium]
PPAQIPPPVQPTAQASGNRLLWPALGVALGGGALLVAGIGVGAGAMALARQINMMPEGSRLDRALYQQGLALEGAAIALDVVGAVGLLAGGAWMGVLLYRDRAARRQVALSPHRMGFVLQGGF